MSQMLRKACHIVPNIPPAAGRKPGLLLPTEMPRTSWCQFDEGELRVLMSFDNQLYRRAVFATVHRDRSTDKPRDSSIRVAMLAWRVSPRTIWFA